jgi:hypothetical protein
MSIAVQLKCSHPIGFLVPSKQIFDSVAQHGTCQKQEGKRWQQRCWKQQKTFQSVERISPRNAGKRKKIELCAARFFRRVEPAPEVGNPDLKSACQQ